MPVAAMGRCSAERWALDPDPGLGPAGGYPPAAAAYGSPSVPAPCRRLADAGLPRGGQVTCQRSWRKSVSEQKVPCQTGYKKKSFTLMVMKPWPRLPREVGDAPSLETFQAMLDGALSNLIQLKLSLPMAGGLG